MKVAEASYQSAVDSTKSVRAGLQDRRAALELAKKKLADGVIRAPFAGLVSERLVQAGEMISERTQVVTIVQVDPLKLRTAVQEKFAALIHPGLGVRFRVESIPDQDFRGKVAIVFFGYTQCPDVCPTTLAEIADAKKLLGADGARVQGVFITVDPERDTPELLKAYVASFGPDFVALRGDAAQTAAAAKEFKVYYKRVDGKTPGSYFMEHTAASFIFDPQGRIRLYSRYGTGAQALADDLKLLLNEKA